MPKKTMLDVDPKLASVVDAFESLSAVRYEMALDAYEAQDDDTRKVIDRVVGTLRQNATGTIAVKVGGSMQTIKVSDETFGFNLLWLAVEIVKDLAFVGIRVANFKFDLKHCASCGEEL